MEGRRERETGERKEGGKEALSRFELICEYMCIYMDLAGCAWTPTQDFCQCVLM